MTAENNTGGIEDHSKGLISDVKNKRKKEASDKIQAMYKSKVTKAINGYKKEVAKNIFKESV